MGILKRITALAIGAAIMCTAVNTVFAENNNRGDTVNIKIDEPLQLIMPCPM